MPDSIVSTLTKGCLKSYTSFNFGLAFSPKGKKKLKIKRIWACSIFIINSYWLVVMHNVCELLEHQLSRAKLHVFLGKITRLFKPNNISPGAVVDDVSESKELLKESINAPVESDAAVRNFDLNADVNENEDTKAAATAAQA